MQPSMEKMSSDLNVKKIEDVSKLYKLYFKNRELQKLFVIVWLFCSTWIHLDHSVENIGNFGRVVILFQPQRSFAFLCFLGAFLGGEISSDFSLPSSGSAASFLSCQKIRSEWASTMRRTLSLSFKSWEESWLALNLCYTIPGQTLNYFSIQSNLDKMTAMSLMMMTSKITLPTTAIATRYSTRYSNFLLLLDSNSTRSQKPLLAGAWSRDRVENLFHQISDFETGRDFEHYIL